MSCYSDLLKFSPEYKSVLHALERKKYPFGCLGLPPAPKGLIIHSITEYISEGALIIVPDDATAEKLNSDLTTYGTRSCTYPARDFNFQAADSSSKEYEQKRIGALAKILSGECNVLITSAEAVLQRAIPPEILKNRIFTLESGMEITIDEIRKKLIKGGYTSCEMVEGAGQFSLRGGILDIFPSDRTDPVRIEFWGDEIDTISEFDILSQRRGESLDKVAVCPVTEILFDSAEKFAEDIEQLAKGIRTKNSAKVKETLSSDAALLRAGILPGSCDKYIPLVYTDRATVLDYFTESLLIVCETSGVKDKALNTEKLSREEIKELFLDGVLCKGLDDFYITFDELTKAYTKNQTIYLDNFARGSFDTPVKDLITFKINQSSSWDGSYKILLEDVMPLVRKKYTVIVFAGTEKAAQGLMDELAVDEIHAVLHKGTPEIFISGSINVVSGSVSYGIDSASDKLMIVTYGRYAKSTKKSVAARKKSATAFNSLDELRVGDYVVHETHGIGIFEGIEKRKIDGVIKDYIKVGYAKGDRLFIPVTKLELISKYVGPHEEDGSRTVKLNRLGTVEWERTKSKVRSALKDIAAELIKLYAQRMNSPGYAFSPDIDMQNDFERRFEFDETVDQLRSIDEIKNDMEKPCPMDRLLCGDVGFGKTEVALRAAFKCICDGKQVAILVPTTILAFQHYRTIMHRFEGFPITADMLCRFRTPKEQKEILKKLKSGSIDIVAGTHRVISKDVQFKDLGLLIVDEEQRFGVSQKEKLKEKFPAVDVLTLSATPIPRTLNMAMSGLRDLSVLEEAPMDRYPIQTYVIEHDMGIISQAISKELRRGGQVYYLHNRIDDIIDTAAELQKYFPDAAIDVAHGKMNETELSNAWQKLTEGDIDILVCTTIIETGVDVPNVNTLIIENADRMGLAQLHQLRGRVGRSTRRASAYCTFTKNKQLTEIADRRLSAIREFTQFGSGLKIAMRDLEIRGAGNLLGAEQHGHMASVGYDMYMEMLSEEVAKQKDGGINYEPKKDCLIDISINAYIPDNYIVSYPQRIGIYKRIADVKTQEDAMDVTDELIDRYGEPPESVMGLIKVALLRNIAAQNDIFEIGQKDNTLLLFVNEINKNTLMKLAVLTGRVLSNASSRPYYSVRIKNGQSSLECLEEITNALSVDYDNSTEQ